MDYTYDGRIEFITGPMFSGKTATLLNKIERYLLAKRTVVALKWKGDVRYTEEPYIITHSNLKCPCIPCDDEDLKTIYEQIKDYDVICIDEGAFFKDIVEFCDDLANRGHIVIVASLISTYERKGFNQIMDLLPKCERIITLKAVCMQCFAHDSAYFTKRIIDSKETELVGGSESYIAVCRKCFHKSLPK